MAETDSSPDGYVPDATNLASFGKASGLLIQENRLLARAVFVLDKDGVVRYKEIVSKLAELPDMEKAFKAAQSLL